MTASHRKARTRTCSLVDAENEKLRVLLNSAEYEIRQGTGGTLQSDRDGLSGGVGDLTRNPRAPMANRDADVRV